MELEFDKEIDALLRKARADNTVLADGAVSPHLEADEISAFAENAMPERSKQLYMAHLADCGGCRKILSNVILLNSGAETVAASAIISPAVSVPWYRKLFLFPNLAYVMGSLVLVFSGFLAYSVLQNSKAGLSSDVSQIDDSRPTASGPNFDENEAYANSNASGRTANAANTAMNTMANTVSNSMSAASNTAYPPAPVITANGSGAGTSATPNDREILMDGVDVTAAPKEQPMSEKDRDAVAKSEDKADAPLQEAQKKVGDLALRDTLPPASGPSKTKGPSRNERNDSRLNNRAEGRATTSRNADEESRRRQVSGKSFEFKQGVWYDSAYRGQATKNVSRGTTEYRQLDSGLRIIAESLAGVVVTVWKEKAYRIQ